METIDNEPVEVLLKQMEDFELYQLQEELKKSLEDIDTEIERRIRRGN